MLAVVPLAKANHMGQDDLGAQRHFSTPAFSFSLPWLGEYTEAGMDSLAAPVFPGWPSEPLCVMEAPTVPDTSTAVFRKNEALELQFCNCRMETQYDF